MSDAERIRLIDALLPQTQCGQCGHPGCRPYAEAIAGGEAINHCVPGGQATIDALSELLQTPSLPLDPDYGVTPARRLVAFIREAECIGCTKCIQACPVDAIVGAAKRMHTVLIDECTGCDLCLAPCPVDCIDMVPGPAVPLTWHAPAVIDPATGIARLATVIPDAARSASRARADRARQRFETHLARERARRARQQAERSGTLSAANAGDSGLRDATGNVSVTPGAPPASAVDTAPLMIAAAMARSQLRKLDKQREALLARGADTRTLDAQRPGLEQAVAIAEASLAAAERGEPIMPAMAQTPVMPEASRPVAPQAEIAVTPGSATSADVSTADPTPRTGPGRHRVRTTGDIR